MRASSSFYVLALLATSASTFAAPVAVRDLATIDTSKSGSFGVLDTSCAQCAGTPNDQSTGIPGVASVDTSKTADVAAIDKQILPVETPSSDDDAGLVKPVKAISTVPTGDSTPSGDEDSSFDLFGALQKLLVGSTSDDDKTALFRSIKAYLAKGGLVPSDDTLGAMGFTTPRSRKAITRFLQSGNPDDFPSADDLKEDAANPSTTSPSDTSSSPDLLQSVSAITSPASSDDSDASATASKKPLKLVLRPFTAPSDSIPAGTIACPDQDASAPLGAHLEALVPQVLNLCLDLTAAFVTPAQAAVCPEDRAVFLGVHAKSQAGEGEEIKKVENGQGGPVVRLCEEASVPNP